MRALLCLGLIGLLSSPAAMAQTLPAPLTGFVSDFADVLPPETEARITQTLRDLRRDPGSEVAVVTMRHRMGQPAADIEAYATALFNQWGIGDSSRNDGALILIVTDDNEARLELGAGFPPVWDNHAQRIMDSYMVPRFSEGDYGAGIEAGLLGLNDYVLTPFAEGTSYEETPTPPRLWGGANWLETIVIGLFIALGLGMIIDKERLRFGDLLARRRPCPRCGKMGVTVTTRDQDLPDGAAERVTTRACPHCDWSTSRSRAISSETDSDEGFGGGQSSGGGATGRW